MESFTIYLNTSNISQIFYYEHIQDKQLNIIVKIVNLAQESDLFNQYIDVN